MLKTLIRLLYLLTLVIICSFIYTFFFSEIFFGSSIIIPVIGIWVLSAYFFLPHIHRWFSRIYIPNYFFGRTRTSDGLLGDPVNVAVIGSKKQLIDSMEKSGWAIADELSFKTSLKTVYASLLRKSYSTAPVSSLYLFHKKQELAFQKEINSNPHKRHHVRFWPTPKKWWLPGGYRADWLGAATYDRKIGFSSLTLQFTHKISENTDEERDYLVSNLVKSNPKIEINTADHFTSGYFDRNGGGDRIYTDGALPFITLDCKNINNHV
jgi:hypothetical protein